MGWLDVKLIEPNPVDYSSIFETDVSSQEYNADAMIKKSVLYTNYKLVWLVCLLGSLFYVADAFVDSYISGEGSFTEQLFEPEPKDMWWRLSIFIISFLFGLYAQYLLNRTEEARKQARTAEKFLESIIDNTPQMIFIKDAQDLRFVKVNKEAEKLMGYGREKLIGKNDFDFFPHEQAKFYQQGPRGARKKVPIDISEEEIDSASLGRRTLHTMKVPIEDDAGNSAYLLGISEDITDQINAKNALIDERNRAEQYLHISEALIVGLDADECITLVNNRACEILKRSEEELIGQNWFDIAISKDEREAVKAIYKQVMANKVAWVDHYENEVVAADGSSCCIAWHNTMQQSPTGKIVGLLSSGIDVTDRKAMEDELKMAGAVYKSTNQGVVVTDKDTRIISTNPAFTSITGYMPDEVLGKNPSHLKSEHHDEPFYQNLWENVERNGHWEGEIWDRRKDGEAFPSWQSISSVVNENGELIHYVSVFSDITPIKQYQENLSYLAHHDALTGLPNRLMFNDRVEHALQRCERESTQLALMFLDLNDFKGINDNYGHFVGDQVLKIVSKKLQLLLRKQDTVARLGGDEFLILLESYNSEEDIRKVTDKINEEITSLMRIDDHDIHAGISIGVAISSSEKLSCQDLISAADDAMYRAKNSGSNTYSF